MRRRTPLFMSEARWRRLLLALWLFAVVQLLTTVGMQVFFYGALPGVDNNIRFPASQRFVLEPIAPNRYRVRVGTGSLAYREGARNGDLLDTGDLPAGFRFRIFSGFWWPGESVTLTLRRPNGTTALVPLTAVRVIVPFDYAIANAGLAWMLLFAGVILWRRANVPQARVLTLLLLLFNIGLQFQVWNWDTPVPPLDATLAALSGFPFYLSFALFATYAGLFAQPLSPLRKALTFGVYAYATAIAVAHAFFYAQSAASGVWPRAFDLFIELAFVAFALPLVPVFATLFYTKGSEREQLVWASVSLVPLFVVLAAGGLSTDPTYHRAYEIAASVALAIAPLGLTYSVVNRRLLDIGFVLNRAAVFSAVSLVVITIFILVEWALGGWLSTASHATNLTVAGGLALVLGLSMHHIRHRVVNVVDHAFFRKRRADQDAIITFSRECSYITDRSVLLERAQETLLNHSDASAVAILLDNRHGRYGDVSENDPAVLALRANHDILDLHAVESVIGGDYAFRMASRGRVLGVLVLRHKRSGESYGPDELEVIRRLAHAVGSALDVLAQNGVVDPSIVKLDAICDTLAKLCETQAALRESLSDLSAAMRRS